MNPWPVKTFVHKLSLAGHKQSKKSDCEPSMLAWATQVEACLARLHGSELFWAIPTATAWRNLTGREVKPKIKTLKKQVEELHKVELDVDHLIYP